MLSRTPVMREPEAHTQTMFAGKLCFIWNGDVYADCPRCNPSTPELRRCGWTVVAI